MQPNSFRCRLNRANVNFILGKTSLALQDLEYISKKLSKSREAFFLVADILKKNGLMSPNAEFHQAALVVLANFNTSRSVDKNTWPLKK
jgi:mannitol/fructose-specific phosphotransferase system IIA component (Ntr-type)